MSESPEKRILRLGVVHEGRLVLERRFRRGDDVVVGRSRKCTLALPGELAPESFRLFVHENGQYYLRFTSGMTGTVATGETIMDLEGLREAGKAARVGDAWMLPLADRDRGKVVLGDVEILFQVLTPRKVSRLSGLRREGDWGNPLVERVSSLFGWFSRHKAGEAAAGVRRERRVLRVGVVRQEQILQERLLRKPGDVTIGRSPKCTLDLPIQNAPQSYRIFVYRNGKYYLRFTSAMTGKVAVAGAIKDLDTLRTSGLAQRSGDYWLLPLGEQDRGKLVLGDVSLLFQFVIPPRPVAAEELAAARGGLGAVMHRIRIWATLASTGQQARTVQVGLWLGVAGALLALLASLFMPWLEEYTVDLARAGWPSSRLFGYGWWTGKVVLAASVVGLVAGGVGLLRSTKKLYSFFGLVAGLVTAVFVLITPFVIRGIIRALIANGTLIPMTQVSTEFGYQVAFVGAAMMLAGFIWGLVAQPVFGPEDRVLRLYELWDGTLVREAIFPERRDVSVGIGGSADFVLPIRGGKPVRLFRVDSHGDYWLALLDVMGGELFVDGERHPVAEFASREGARVGGTAYVQVTDGDWGRLEFGRVTLGFEFVRPPKTLVGRRRARAVDSTLLSTFIATSFCVAVFYVVSQFMWNPAGQMETRKSEKRTIKVDVNIIQEKDEKKLEIGEGTGGEDTGSKAEGKFGSADDVQVEDSKKTAVKATRHEETAEERAARLAKEVKSKTILQFLDGGPGASKAGALTAVTGMGGFGEARNTMAVYTEGGGAGATGVIAGGGRSWGGTGGIAATPGGGIQKLSRSEVPGGGGRSGIVKVATEEKTEEAVKIRVGGALGAQSGGGKVDRNAVESLFRRRKGAIQECYERTLKVNPNLSGKVTIRFTIGTGGTVTAIEVVENTTGDSGVAACIVQKVRSWPFPPAEGDEVTFVYPFVLTSGG